MTRIIAALLTFFLLITSLQAFAQLNNDPDTFNTDNGDLKVHPILHGTVIFEWNDLDVYVDPWGSANLYEGKSAPELILITHPHGDHLSPETLSFLDTENATFIVPQVVADQLPEEYSGQVVVLGNGDTHSINGVDIMAVPMYNLPNEGARHTKGWGNGYVITMGGKRVYISGDTEDIPEMRQLENIDIAFVCMNLPYTMDIYQAASGVLEFEPKVMYPYHHRGQDINRFKEVVDWEGKDFDVRLKNWYPEQ